MFSKFSDDNTMAGFKEEHLSFFFGILDAVAVLIDQLRKLFEQWKEVFTK